MDRDWTASFSIRFRNDTCIIILDKKYNIALLSYNEEVHDEGMKYKAIIYDTFEVDRGLQYYHINLLIQWPKEKVQNDKQ
jgi:hypothetical protein